MAERRTKIKIAWLLLAYIAPVALFFVVGNFYAEKRISSLKIAGASPHTKLGRGGAYPPNNKSFETTYHGDLCVRAGYQVLKDEPSQCPFTAGARSAWFITDRNGFKTLGDIENYDYLLVGDSFLSATGGDKMTEQLGSVLSEETEYSFYEASHPGWGVNDYVSAIKKIGPEKGEVIVLLYEGNDLVPLPPDKSLIQKNISPWRQRLRPLYAAVANTFIDAFRVSRQLLSDLPLIKLVNLYATGSRGVVDHGYDVKEINGKRHAFFVPASRVSVVDARLAESDFEALEGVKDKICSIVVIPSKHSVFLEKTGLEVRHPSFSSQIQAFRESGIEVLDLTPHFQEIVNNHPLVDYWWSDDTHWRAPGIEYASRLIRNKSRCLN